MLLAIWHLRRCFCGINRSMLLLRIAGRPICCCETLVRRDHSASPCRERQAEGLSMIEDRVDASRNPQCHVRSDDICDRPDDPRRATEPIGHLSNAVASSDSAAAMASHWLRFCCSFRPVNRTASFEGDDSCDDRYLVGWSGRRWQGAEWTDPTPRAHRQSSAGRAPRIENGRW
jgi:hypothetical protein